jgi:hypothetical protein
MRAPDRRPLLHALSSGPGRGQALRLDVPFGALGSLRWGSLSLSWVALLGCLDRSAELAPAQVSPAQVTSAPRADLMEGAHPSPQPLLAAPTAPYITPAPPPPAPAPSPDAYSGEAKSDEDQARASLELPVTDALSALEAAGEVLEEMKEEEEPSRAPYGSSQASPQPLSPPAELTLTRAPQQRAQGQKEKHKPQRAYEARDERGGEREEALQPLAQLNPYSRAALSDHQPLKDALDGARPSAFWPRQGYFENTYVGGDLSLESERAALPPEVARALESSWAGLQAPPLDPPSEGGVALSATLSHPSTQGPRRVLLQVGLKGSERYGWRRPPLSLVVVVDPRWGEGDGGLDLVSALSPVLSELTPVDEVGVVCGALRLEPRAPEALREALIALPEPPLKGDEPLALALSAAGVLLEAAAANPHRAPGAQEALLMCGAGCVSERVSLEGVAHSLNTAGALTSVLYRHPRGAPAGPARLGGELWRVAEVGHGGYWEAQEGGGSFDAALRELTRREFERISRVVARLLRLSVKLARGVELIEVLGSRMLTHQQAAEVKAREVVMDQRLSARLGIASDRGEDDEGVQVVIPAFYGGDRHFITLALWVEGPGEVAEVQLKYKDMVRAQNASASAAARLSAEVASLGELHWEVRRVAAQQLDAAALARVAERGDFLSQGGQLRHRLNSLAAERGAGAAAVDAVWGRGGRKAARALSRALVGSAR